MRCLICIMALLMFCSCAANRLHGKWQTEHNGFVATLEFRRDGTLIDNLGLSTPYEIIDGNRIRISAFGLASVEEFSFEGENLMFRGYLWKRAR